MRFRSTLIVLVLALGLGGFVLWSERRERRVAGERAALQALLPVPPAAVEALSFTYGDKQINLERRNASWIVTHPVEAPCDAGQVAGFLDSLSAARREDRVGRGDLARYGLDHPAATVRLQLEGGARHELRFGRINPLQTLVYVMVDDGDEVLLTTSSLLTASLTSLFGWRDKHMVDIDPGRVTRLRFSTINAGSLIVHRDAEAGWVTAGEVPWRTDPVRMRGLLLQLAGLQAIGVGAENKQDLHKFGLGNRKLSAVLEDSLGRVVADVVFGYALYEGAYYAMVPNKPEIFQVDGQLVDTLVGFVHEPRDRRIFPPFDPDLVTRVDVAAPQEFFVLERRGRSNWVVVRSDKGDSTFVLDPASVQAMLEQLATAELADFPAQQPPASLYEPPEWSVDLFDARGLVSGVRIGRRDPQAGLHTFARGVKDRAVFLVSPATLLSLPFELERLGAPEIVLPGDAERG